VIHNGIRELARWVPATRSWVPNVLLLEFTHLHWSGGPGGKISISLSSMLSGGRRSAEHTAVTAAVAARLTLLELYGIVAGVGDEWLRGISLGQPVRQVLHLFDSDRVGVFLRTNPPGVHGGDQPSERSPAGRPLVGATSDDGLSLARVTRGVVPRGYLRLQDSLQHHPDDLPEEFRAVQQRLLNELLSHVGMILPSLLLLERFSRSTNHPGGR